MTDNSTCGICAVPADLKSYTFYGSSGPYKHEFYMCPKCSRQWLRTAAAPARVETTVVPPAFDEMASIRDWCEAQRAEWTRGFLTGKISFRNYQDEMERCLSVANERAARVYREQKNERTKTA